MTVYCPIYLRPLATVTDAHIMFVLNEIVENEVLLLPMCAIPVVKALKVIQCMFGSRPKQSMYADKPRF
jgi:hypothetical protein